MCFLCSHRWCSVCSVVYNFAVVLSLKTLSCHTVNQWVIFKLPRSYLKVQNLTCNRLPSLSSHRTRTTPVVKSSLLTLLHCSVQYLSWCPTTTRSVRSVCTASVLRRQHHSHKRQFQCSSFAANSSHNNLGTTTECVLLTRQSRQLVISNSHKTAIQD